MDKVWAGIDAGKEFHWACVLDASGAEMLSCKVENDEVDLLKLIDEVLSMAEDVVWATDQPGGSAALLLALLWERDQRVLYIPGLTVDRARDAYRGESKTDARDAHVIADQARMRSDLGGLTAREGDLAELQLLLARRRDLVADRTRSVTRLRETLLALFPALERALDLNRRGALTLVAHYQTPASIRRMGRKRLTSFLKNRGVKGAHALAEKALAAAKAQSATLPAEDVAARIVVELAGEALDAKERVEALDGASDEEAKARADFDLRWKVALGVGLEERPFAKSTLQLFRARLILHEQVRTIFHKSLDFARRTGYFRHRKVRTVLDTSYILGRGAVKDTYNLLGDGVRKLVGALAASAGREPAEWAREYGLSRYIVGSSLKGEAEIDWDEPQAREVFLRSVVDDADRLLDTACATLERFPVGDHGRGRLHEAAALLEQLLLQDIGRREDGIYLKQGVSPDRVVSVHDPEMRHGRKSASKRFDGHKAQVAVDPESQLIMAADVMAGNVQDHERALELVEQVEANADVTVEETVGDCAYGDSGTRQTFAEAGRKLVAKVANRRGQARFPKDDFRIDLETMSCVCPAGQQTQKVVSISSGKRYGAPDGPLRAFRFDATICDACALRPSCMRARLGKGRLVMIHPQEALLQEARAFQTSEAFAPYRKLRQAAEHRLARLMQLGARQARYFGRTKTLFQLLMAATVANLTLVGMSTGLMRDRNHPKTIVSIHISALLATLIAICRSFATLSLDPRLWNQTWSLGFRPHF